MPWIKKNLGRLCKEGDIVRFDKGVYYIPTDTKIGKSELDPRLVVMKKYIRTKQDVFGYYSGAAFLNAIGLSIQFPSLYEIYTNRETTRAREVVVGGQRLILRKARTHITAENYGILSFLELMNETEADFYDEYKHNVVIEFIKKMNINRNQLTSYIKYFPDKVAKTLIESQLIYVIASESGNIQYADGTYCKSS